jgi:hypothetical protein
MDDSKINPQTKEKMYYKSEVQFKVGCQCFNIPKIVEAQNAQEADKLMMKWACRHLGIAEDDDSICAADRDILVGSSDEVEWTKPVEITVWKWQDEMFDRSLVKRTNFDD